MKRKIQDYALQIFLPVRGKKPGGYVGFVNMSGRLGLLIGRELDALPAEDVRDQRLVRKKLLA